MGGDGWGCGGGLGCPGCQTTESCPHTSSEWQTTNQKPGTGITDQSQAREPPPLRGEINYPWTRPSSWDGGERRFKSANERLERGWVTNHRPDESDLSESWICGAWRTRAWLYVAHHFHLRWGRLYQKWHLARSVMVMMNVGGKSVKHQWPGSSVQRTERDYHAFTLFCFPHLFCDEAGQREERRPGSDP